MGLHSWDCGAMPVHVLQYSAHSIILGISWTHTSIMRPQPRHDQPTVMSDADLSLFDSNTFSAPQRMQSTPMMFRGMLTVDPHTAHH